ncbi:MAG TPA: 2-C-methyl-D-erythritol 4-phosphate cytidylyltransferase [Pyrinomonadaceae bacterium]|nr:2-C-methyl-D-erythritol 4-phosphate cytidylyltransferase [Pyrinomonadaceae bacterium]
MMDLPEMNIAIIVAAGTGSRFNSETPKQFLEILGKPVIRHTLERFEAAPSVDSIVLVLAKEQVSRFDKMPMRKLSSVVAGGKTRAQSVLNGLNAAGEKCSLVVVHDGARPLVSVDEIERTIARAKETGAACLVAPVTDTIKSVSGGEIVDTLDRDNLRRALTPQAFTIEILKKAFEGVDLNESITDECFLVEKIGLSVAIVEGSSRNIKITHPEDLILAEALLRADRLKAES